MFWLCHFQRWPAGWFSLHSDIMKSQSYVGVSPTKNNFWPADAYSAHRKIHSAQLWAHFNFPNYNYPGYMLFYLLISQSDRTLTEPGDIKYSGFRYCLWRITAACWRQQIATRTKTANIRFCKRSSEHGIYGSKCHWEKRAPLWRLEKVQSHGWLQKERHGAQMCGPKKLSHMQQRSL